MSQVKGIFVGVVALLVIITSFMTAGINDAGYRTVIQYPTGKLIVKSTPGIYFKWFGEDTTYRDVITFDYDKNPNNDDEASISQQGIPVRYQDGGKGTIYGLVRYSLPNDDATMIALHKAFRSNRGLAAKLLKPIAEESMNLTAGLMSSEEAYAEKRGTFTQWSNDQMDKGKFQTELQQIFTEDEIGNRVVKNVPVIKYGTDGLPIHLDSDLKDYGIDVSGFQITDWDFEARTLEQIATKREATMAIITAKANAERAKQDAITAEEQGKANVMTARYEKEVEKAKAVVDAERQKEVAVIEAEQRVDVAEQQKLEAEQKKLAAAEYKKEQILRGEGDGEYKRLVMEADGALAQKLDAYVKVNALYADAVAKQKWVPEVQMGTSDGTNGGSAVDLINLLNVKTAKDLSLDMKVK